LIDLSSPDPAVYAAARARADAVSAEFERRMAESATELASEQASDTAEVLYDTLLLHHVDRIAGICKQHGIPFMMVFQLEELKGATPSTFKPPLHAVDGFIPGHYGASSAMRKLREMFPADVEVNE
jgi:hypothetical protein